MTGAGCWRGADPGCSAGCNTAWGWACSCGAQHDRETCGAENCRRCWEAEWPRQRAQFIVRVTPDGRELFQCVGFDRCGWWVEIRDGACEECAQTKGDEE